MMKYAVLFPQLVKQVTYLFGENVSLSYPMADRVNGIPVDTFFLYPHSASLTRARPFALLRVCAETGRILSYTDCRAEDFMGEAGAPLTEKLNYALPKKMGVKEFKLEQSMLNKMYEAVRLIAFREELTSEEADVLRKYWVMLENAVPSDLLPYYLTMGKNFRKWGYDHV